MSETQPQGYIALPAARTGPGVLVLHAWWGLNQTIRDLCDRLASEGYVAFAPDLYHGQVANTIDGAQALSSALSEKFPQGLEAASAAAAYLRGLSDLPERGVAVIGFSMGAFYALELSNAAPEHIHKVVVFYGTGPDDFSASQAEYLGHFAENDPYEPPEAVEALRDALSAAQRPATFYSYHGTGHWFFEPDRVDAYNVEAAQLAWERTVEFLRT